MARAISLRSSDSIIMATPPNTEPVYVDAWTLRCIFNQSLLLAGVSTGTLKMVPKNLRKKPSRSTRSQDPPGTTSQTYTYRDKNDNEVATVHFYDYKGTPLSPPDPKTVTVGSRRYTVHSEDLKANPEKRYFRTRKWQSRYGCLRKLKCCFSGPLASVALLLEEPSSDQS
jgi:hypothetical protein